MYKYLRIIFTILSAICIAAAIPLGIFFDFPGVIGAAAGAVAVLMMPRTNPTRRLAAKAANKMEDVAWKMSDTISSKLDDLG